MQDDQTSPKTIEYNNAISFDYSMIQNGSSKSGTASDAGAVSVSVLSQVATNDIPCFSSIDDNIDNCKELPSFNPDAQRIKACQPAKNSLSFTTSCAAAATSQLMYSRSGWGIPLIGLKGGAGGDTSVANGTSGWGPPPSGGAGSASASGWGAPPPPNPVASAAWGAPGPGLAPGQGNKTQSGKLLHKN